MAVKIKSVIKNSPAFSAGIKENDMLVSLNGHKIRDVLDYMYYAAESSVAVEIDRSERKLVFHINKGEYDDLGLEFDTFLMDNKQGCTNKCIFCFIDQMPPNMRETLYFKDDDSRLSFLQGNYVTLTNLDQGEIDRIIEMRLNINISVHTTNPELRCMMMNNRFAGEKLDYIRQFAEAGIAMNCQIVLCPGINDGDELRRTLTDLGNFMPNIKSIAVVPVGLTKFRKNLYPLEKFGRENAGKTIDLIEEFQKIFLEKYETRLVFPADEFFVTAEREIPSGEYYEDYCQYENGIGMLRSLADEFEAAIETADEPAEKRTVSMTVGSEAYRFISELVKKAEDKWKNIKVNVCMIRNDFFGDTITVTGLITAGDIIAQLKGRELGDELLISTNMLMRDSDIFLDDLTVKDVEKALGINVRAVGNDGYELLDAILNV